MDIRTVHHKHNHQQQDSNIGLYTVAGKRAALRCVARNSSQLHSTSPPFTSH